MKWMKFFKWETKEALKIHVTNNAGYESFSKMLKDRTFEIALKKNVTPCIPNPDNLGNSRSALFTAFITPSPPPYFYRHAGSSHRMFEHILLCHHPIQPLVPRP